ncbi:MAG TPA: hypothetical protein VK876_08350 [Rubrivivax sp.]|nr:hypothetical protein [Rubrivivax sp.]
MTLTARSAAGAGGAALLLAACAPALDWRDVRPEGSNMTLLMPCKPTAQQRRLPLAGAAVILSLHACSADGQTWGVAHADVEDPARVAAALAELRVSAAANVDAGAAEPLQLQVPGATPQPASERVRLEGHLPDGRPVQVQVAVFAQGTRVFQVTALGERLPGEAAETFFGSIRFAP